MSRGNYRFSRGQNHDYVRGERVDWLDRFADSVAGENENGQNGQKSAVEVARNRSHQSLIDQINSIVSNKPVHATVESKVQEMQERIGLKEYLKRVSNEEDGNTKTAQDIIESNPDEVSELENQDQEEQDVSDVFDELPNGDDVKDWIKFFIERDHGAVTVPAILNDISDAFGGEIGGVVADDRLAKYISDSIIEKQRGSVMSIDDSVNPNAKDDITEDVDNANSDYFRVCKPSSGY